MVMFLNLKISRAIWNGDIPRLEKLLAGGGDINAYVHRDATPLMLAVMNKNEAVVDFLLTKGAKPDVADSSRWTPLHRAALDGQLGIAIRLLKAGADPNLRTNHGVSVPGMAQRHGHTDIAEVAKPFMKKLSNLFALPEAPVPETPEPAPAPVSSSGWMLMGEQQVAHAVGGALAGYKITDVFNFASRERIRILHNTATQQDKMETTAFDALPAREQLEEALRALKDLGGKADPAALADKLGKATRLPAPEARP